MTGVEAAAPATTAAAVLMWPLGSCIKYRGKYRGKYLGKYLGIYRGIYLGIYLGI